MTRRQSDLPVPQPKRRPLHPILLPAGVAPEWNRRVGLSAEIAHATDAPALGV